MNSSPPADDFAPQEELDSPQRRGISLRSLFGILKRQIVPVAGVTSLFASISYFYATSQPPTYRGSFQILVEPVTTEERLSEPTAVTRGGGSVPSQGAFTLDYPTQIALLQSPRILTRVLERVRDEVPNFSGGELRSGLEVDRLGREYRIIEVIFKHSNPEVTRVALDVLAEEYLRYSLEERKTRIGEGVGFIETQLTPLRERARSLQDKLQQLQQQHSFFNPTAQGQSLTERLRTVTDQLEDTRQTLREQRELRDRLRDIVGLDPEAALAASRLSEDPLYQNLLGDLQSLEEEILTESARFRPDSPIVAEIRSRRDNLQPLLDERAREVIGPQLSQRPELRTFQGGARRSMISNLVAADTAIAQAEIREATLSVRRAELEAAVRSFPEIAREYDATQRELNIVDQTLNQLLSERERLRVEAAQNQVPWELVYEPQLPLDRNGEPVPLDASIKRLLAAGTLAGLAVGVALALAIERRRDAFHATEDLAAALPVPVLETIPHDARLPAALAGRGATPSEAVEVFSAIYAKLLFFYADTPLRSLAIGSPQTGDGKTTIAVQLARTAAAAGQRVLLVDANLRDPQIHRLLGLPNQQGLKQLLLRSREPQRQSLLQRVPDSESLFALTSGGTTPESSQLLASTAMEELSERLQASFDLVIYDTPALEGFADAKFAAMHTDGLLLTVGLKSTRQSVTLAAFDELVAFSLPVVGTIANAGALPRAQRDEEPPELLDDAPGSSPGTAPNSGAGGSGNLPDESVSDGSASPRSRSPVTADDPADE